MLLEFKNINKSFGEKKVLKDISFAAESGKALGLLGRNGAGKTTSIRILMNVFPEDTGEILVDKMPINRKSITFGYLPEERGLYPKKKVLEQLTFFCELKGMKRAEAVESIDYWLSKLDMYEYRNKRLDTLSKGNQQKIQLITAIAHNPDVVVLDEPFSGLDPVNAKSLENVVKEIIDKGKIVIFSSHQMNYIEEFCDNIAIINDGKIVLSGNLKEIKKSYPRNRIIIRGSDIDKEIKIASESEKKAVMQEYLEKYDVDEIKIAEPSLNDIFVDYTDDKDAAEDEK